MRSYSLVRIVFSLIAGLLIASSASAADVLDTSSGSSIRIVSIQPPPSQTFKNGEKLKISAEVEYTLAAEKGSIRVFVQDDKERSLALGTSDQAIVSGKGTITASAEVEIKDAKSAQFIVALYHNDGRSTAITDNRVFQVFPSSSAAQAK